MSLKLQYFPIRGFGEYIRTLLIDQGIDFIDERIPLSEWPKIKDSTPFGQLPILHVDDKQIPQVSAILRYLARQHKDERIHLDIFFDALKDVRSKYTDLLKLDEYERYKDEYDRVTYPKELKKVENFFKAVDNGEKWILGEKTSFVDYVLFEELELALASNPHNLETLPSFKDFHRRFSVRSNLQAYFSRRAEEKPKFSGSGKI